MAGTATKDAGFQPWSRFHYNRYMNGVDVADQYNGTYQSRHRAVNYFWRRVFEQKLMQACTNAWLLFRWWLADMRSKVVAEIKGLEEAGAIAGQDTADGLLLVSLQGELERLDALAKQSRAQWLRALSTYLMTMCQLGHAKRGSRKQSSPKSGKRGVKSSHLVQLKGGQRFCCECRQCSARKPDAKGGPRGRKVNHACKCSACEEVGGVALCRECYEDKDKHVSAKQWAHASGKKRPAFKWCR